jgi:hypothetical protein
MISGEYINNKKTILFLILIFLLPIENQYSQFIKSYGFQAGILSHTTFVINTGSKSFNGSDGLGLGFDLGFFGECTVYKRLSMLAEIHLNDRGVAAGNPPITSPEPFPFGYSDYLPISNRFRYLTIQALGKYNFAKIDTGFYSIIGIRTDIMLQNYYTGYHENYIKLPNRHFELGGTIGFGYNFPPGIFLEFEYNPDFTRMYRYDLDGYNASFQNYSLMFSVGYIVK